MKRIVNNPTIAELKEVAKEMAKLSSDVFEVVLFGSRARGDNASDSDVDIVVITNVEHDHTEMSKIKKGLSVSLPMDMLMVSREEFESKRHIPGNIFNRVNKEGIPLYGT